MQSIEDILPKVKDNNFQKELANEEDKYLALEKECELFAKSEKIDGIKDNNWFEKAKLWSSININNDKQNNTSYCRINAFRDIYGFYNMYKRPVRP